MTDITVIVVTRNRAAMLRDALQSLIHQDTGGGFSYDIFRQAFPLVVQYLAIPGSGEALARNVGLRAAQGEWIAFCDDDQVADQAWLQELHREALASQADCVGGAVALSLPPSEALELGPRSRGELGEKLFDHRSRRRLAKDVMGAGNCLLRKSLVETVGEFDITFRQGVDTDFFWRVEKAGFTLSLAPRALVYHIIPAARLQTGYLRQVCLRKGAATARIIDKHEGSRKLLLQALLRLGIICVRDVPQVLIAAGLNNPGFQMDCRCGLWFSLGFLRSALFHLAPSRFPQTRFFRQLQ